MPEFLKDGKFTEAGKEELNKILKMQEEAISYEEKARKLNAEAGACFNGLFGKPANAKLSWHDVIKALL